MRVGILIIGSLFWDWSHIRCRWRQERLCCSQRRVVTAPIRYGKKAEKRGDTYTMVFSRSAGHGKALAVPAKAECSKPEHLLHEAGRLWAAERDVEEIEGICANWGKVCLLPNPKTDPKNELLKAWSNHIAELGADYSALSRAKDEQPVLDHKTGLALFDWPHDVESNENLSGFDLLLMTANSPTLTRGQYASAKQIASAWREDTADNVMYFYNNRHVGITTFEDNDILQFLRGEPPNAARTRRARKGPERRRVSAKR
jgi:hypothetical protein